MSLYLIKVTKNELVCVQQKNNDGVCIIPPEQFAAAELLLLRYNKKILESSGSKRSCELRFSFEPAATTEEAESMMNDY